MAEGHPLLVRAAQRLDAPRRSRWRSWRAPAVVLTTIGGLCLLARRESPAAPRSPELLSSSSPSAAAASAPAPARSTWLALAVSNEYERRLGQQIGDGLYPIANLVEMHKPTKLSVRGALGDEDREEYAWEIASGLGGDAAPHALTSRGDAVEATFVALGAHAVRVTPRGAAALFEFEVTAKYVRRELRELSTDDREHYFKVSRRGVSHI